MRNTRITSLLLLLSLFLLCTTCLFAQSVFVNTDEVTVNLPLQEGPHTIIASLPVGSALGQSPSFDVLVSGSILGYSQSTAQVMYGLSIAEFTAGVYLCDTSDCSGSTKVLVGQTRLSTGPGTAIVTGGNTTALTNDFKVAMSLARKNAVNSALLLGTLTGEMQQHGGQPYIAVGNGGQGSASVVKTTTNTPIDLTSSLYVVVDMSMWSRGYAGKPTTLNATVNLLRVHTLQ